jgi:malate dehydrogenase (oxaloacetate-decarboxylating)(NADP+)
MNNEINLPKGYALLHNPFLNRGSAFTHTERTSNGIEGLLPPTVDTLELQIARIHLQLDSLDNDLQKYLVLSDLQTRNEV